jgi:hypothetical protein
MRVCLFSRRSFSVNVTFSLLRSRNVHSNLLLKFYSSLTTSYFRSSPIHLLFALRRGADKSLAFPISRFPICSTTERIFLGWVKEVRTTKS